MKSLIYITFILFCFLECNSKRVSDQILRETDEEQQAKMLDKKLHDELMVFIQRYKAFNTNASAYSIKFLNEDNLFSTFNKKDSIAFISTFNCNDEHVGYKGIINFDEFVVAIEDEKNIGLSFYDTYTLSEVSIDSLKCDTTSVTPAFTFRISGKQLKKWGGD